MSLTLTQAARYALSDIRRYSRHVIGRELRSYQIDIAEALLGSIFHDKGDTFTVEISRQGGKNELSAQLEAYLLTLHMRAGGNIVKASPTFKPQTINSLDRLKARLRNPWTIGLWRPRAGYIVAVGRAEAHFFSAEPTANVVGATAGIALEGDEAQDIRPAIWEKRFVPMGASTDATTVLYGTTWTANTLLAQTKAECERLQNRDGRRRVFVFDAEFVGSIVPAYARHVAKRIAALGRNHPLIKTQYFLEPIDEQGGLFPPERQALMRGTHERRRQPEPGKTYGILIDVAGQDENALELETDRDDLQNPRRDAIAITVIEISPGRHQAYFVVDRHLWLGLSPASQYARINALVEHWRARWIIPDATGVGAGLASFLAQTWADRVVAFEFTSATKSDLGWEFVGIIETGRFKDHADDHSAEYRQFWYEVGACRYKVFDGPGNRIRWGVEDQPAYDGVIARGHDDLLISAALVAVIDKQPSVQYFPGKVIRPQAANGDMRAQRIRKGARRGKY